AQPPQLFGVDEQHPTAETEPDPVVGASLEDPPEDVDHDRIVAGSGVPLQLLESGGDSSVVRRVGELRGTRPGDGDHPGPVRNLLLLEAVRVALTIPPLVLMSNRFVDASRESDPLEELERERDLALLRATPLLGVAQLDETVSIVAGEADAAEIAQQGGEGERLDV